MVARTGHELGKGKEGRIKKAERKRGEKRMKRVELRNWERKERRGRKKDKLNF